MSNPKDDDIIASINDQPEALGDQQLEDVDAGLGYVLKDVHVTSFDVNGANADTIYGGSFADTVYGGTAIDNFSSTQLFGGSAVLRKRPGR